MYLYRSGNRGSWLPFRYRMWGEKMFDFNEKQLLSQYTSFNFREFLSACKKSGCKLAESTLRRKLRELVQRGEIIRVGRDAYCIPNGTVRPYSYPYSDVAVSLANTVHESYPLVAFSIFELIQLNEFANHQLAHNILFLSVENEAAEFVFDTLKQQYPGKVLLDPTPELYQQYWYDGMIVIDRLVTEAPKGYPEPWNTCLEKMLVDLLSNPIIMESVSESEYPAILEDAFSKYGIDESCLFRYAKRRGAEKRLKKMIRHQTNIKLRTE